MPRGDGMSDITTRFGGEPDDDSTKPDDEITIEIVTSQDGTESEIDDDASGASDESGNPAIDEFITILRRVEPVYRRETERLGQLTGVLDGLMPGICQPIPAGAVEVSQDGMTDNLAFAREETIKAILKAIRAIAKRSDLAKQAARVVGLMRDSAKEGAN